MDFPRNVYFSPGKFPAAHGRSFGLVSVSDRDEYDRHIEAGYWPSVPEAIENQGSIIKEVETEPKARRGRPPKVE